MPSPSPTVQIPPLIDIHVHVREPGHEYKETYETCFAAAYNSGITTICAMPNTSPELTDEESYTIVNTAAQKAAVKYSSPSAPKMNYYLYQAATHPPTPILPHSNIIGLKMYLNCTTGNLLIKDPTTIEHYFKIPETKSRPIMCHAEIDILPTILELSQKYKQRTHICHVARKSELELIRSAKLTNSLLTCEVAPHHLLLTTPSIPDSIFNVKPNLQTTSDLEALWEGIDDRTIDMIATDHAPHTIDEKMKGAFGFTGLETLLPTLLNQVKLNKLTLDRLVELTHIEPMKILAHVVPSPEITHDLIVKNPHHPETISSLYTNNIHSKAKWSPFIGHDVIPTPVIKFVKRE